MKIWIYFLNFTLILMLSACGFNQKISNTPPIPESPFPIDVTASLNEYIFENDSGKITMLISLHTNKETNDNVALSYQLFRDENNQWVNQNQQELLNEKLKLKEERTITHTIQPLNAGRYRILINGQYGSMGKEISVIFSISEQGKLTIESDS
ncbi:hypothetical protein B5G50_10720 [Brevibacillus brevis]|uniref:hypothetical protein n=1 Tax=Brevibacillus brevis TaxID=1393 RepID=UPI000B3A8357|nr:hypothetical protein [Brevibacillus brevis]OUQ88104.1 hypothetical protein B5G50_10720 [Brevibacillus brevis]